jgi:hypothetical protein
MGCSKKCTAGNDDSSGIKTDVQKQSHHLSDEMQRKKLLPTTKDEVKSIVDPKHYIEDLSTFRLQQTEKNRIGSSFTRKDG